MCSAPVAQQSFPHPSSKARFAMKNTEFRASAHSEKSISRKASLKWKM
jgi:hypothetical protein